MEQYQQLNKDGHFRQHLAAILINLGTLSYAMQLGWGSPAEGTLLSDNSPVGPVSEEGFSWLNSLPFLGGTVGPCVWGPVISRFGVKRSAQMYGAVLLLAWITLLVPVLELSYFARALAGFAGACCYILGPTYITEIASEEIRGILSSYVMLFNNAGILLVYVLGAYLPYFWWCFVGLCIAATFLVLFAFMVESPEFLLRKGMKEEAVKSLAWLRQGNEKKVTEDLARMERLDVASSGASLKDLIKTRGNRQAMFISLGVFIGQQFCGAIALLSYAAGIVGASGANTDASLAAVTIGAVQLAGSYFSTFIVGRYPRKALLVGSFGSMSISLFVLGCFFYLNHLEWDLSTFSFIPVVCLCVHIFTYAAGAGPVPYNVMSEVLAPEIRALATSIIILVATLSAFTVVKLVFFLKTNFGFHGCFWFFGSMSFLFLIFTVVCVPETFRRPLEEILRELNGEKCDERPDRTSRVV